MICKNCGTENEEGNVFCINCGSRVEGVASDVEPLTALDSQSDHPDAFVEPEGPAHVPFVSSEQPAYAQQPQPTYAPPPQMYQQPVPPPPPQPPVLPQAQKGPPDTCRILRMPTAPDMPGLSFFDGTTLQYFGYMVLFGFLNMLVVAMPVVLLVVFGGMAGDRVPGTSFEMMYTVDLSGMETGYIVLLAVTAILAFLVMLVILAWMYTVLLRWMSHHTIVNDHRLVFIGRPAELLKKIVIYWLLSTVTLGIYAIWVPVKLLRWKAANTRFAT